MRVKIGDKYYDSKNTPIKVVLDSKERRRVTNMPLGADSVTFNPVKFTEEDFLERLWTDGALRDKALNILMEQERRNLEEGMVDYAGALAEDTAVFLEKITASIREFGIYNRVLKFGNNPKRVELSNGNMAWLDEGRRRLELDYYLYARKDDDES